MEISPEVSASEAAGATERPPTGRVRYGAERAGKVRAGSGIAARGARRAFSRPQKSPTGGNAACSRAGSRPALRVTIRGDDSAAGSTLVGSFDGHANLFGVSAQYRF